MKMASTSLYSSVEKSRVASGSDCYKKAIWYPLVGLAIILFTPEPFVADSEFLERLIEDAGHWIPAINNLSAVSEFPLSTGLYLTLMWVLLPVSTGWWLLKMPFTVSTSFPSVWLLLRLFILGIFFLILLASVIYWFPYHPEGRELSFHAGRSGVFLSIITHSRVGVGLGFGAFFYVFSLFLMSWLRTVWLCVIRLTHFFRI
jgi:hypothetical protein